MHVPPPHSLSRSFPFTNHDTFFSFFVCLSYSARQNTRFPSMRVIRVFGAAVARAVSELWYNKMAEKKAKKRFLIKDGISSLLYSVEMIGLRI